MQALDAGLAFAITMLILAMVVTTIVETLHRVLRLREKGLELLLGNFYERVLSGSGGTRFAGVDHHKLFVDMMTVNRAPVGKLGGLTGIVQVDAKAVDRHFFNRLWSGRRLSALGLTGFMERLGGSAYGMALVERAGADREGVEWILKDVAQKFDAYGQESSEYFESRARLLSVLVGFAVAVIVNVNALTLFETYMKRPDITQAVIDRGKAVTENYENLNKEVVALQASAAAARQATAAKGEGTPAQPASDAAALQKQVGEAQKRVVDAADEAAAAVRNLRSVGVPIGWDAQSVGGFWRSPLLSVFGLVLGGLLIGLGAPFWYSTVQSLTSVRTLARGRDAGTPAGAPAPAVAAAPTQLPGTPIEAFHAALGAMLATGAVRPAEEAVG